MQTHDTHIIHRVLYDAVAIKWQGYGHEYVKQKKKRWNSLAFIFGENKDRKKGVMQCH